MKKAGYIMLFLLLAFVTQADLVDDFESYSPGSVVAPWVEEAVDVAAIAADGGNQYITYGDDSGDWRHVYRPAGLEVTTSGTLFFRVYVDAETGIDHAFGLTDEDAPTWYSAYGPYVRVTDDTAGTAGVVSLDTRDGGSFVDDIATLNVGQWYNIWLVIDTAGGDSGLGGCDIYVTEDGVSATGTTAVYSSSDFRKAYADPLDTFLLFSGTGTATKNTRVDDVHVLNGVYLEIPISGFPYGPSVEQETPTGTAIATTLKWKAAGDPDGIYAVNPAIVDQSIFMRTDTDPNLVYVGNTNADPGTDDPNSQYSFTGTTDTTYYWAVVEELDGYQQAFVVGDDIDTVDPNNIIGPTWSYESTKSGAAITVQPSDVRVFTTDPVAEFTVEFTSPVNDVTVTWFKNDVAIDPQETGITVTTDPRAFSTLTIDAPALADEGKYYARLSVDDDIYTATRMLAIKQLLAQFDFEQNLDDTSGNGAPSGQGKSIAGLTEPNSLEAVDVTLTYVTGIAGDAVYLNGEQYIDLDSNGYPKAGPLDTIGDVRGEGYEKQGFGRGMDEGSILCWVKLESDGSVFSNASNTDGTHFAVTTNGIANARIIVRGENWDTGWQNVGEANGTYQMDDFSLQDGQWYLFAATWNDSATARIYINGEQVATNSQGYAEVFTPWDLGNLVGASRQGQPNRHLLNAADFLTGAIDSLRVYNYAISADAIAQEYEAVSGNTPCANQSFDGYLYNFDNTSSSYCKIDLADFADFALNWLKDGLYDAP